MKPSKTAPTNSGSQFTRLGHPSILTSEQTATPRTILESFPNPAPHRDYEVKFVFPEFTSMCPVTGQPDFATITIEYVPDRKCVEMKSLKLYFLAFRNKGIFYEAATNQILDDLVAVLQPRRMTVTGDFAVRGGTAGIITATHDQAVQKRRKR
ncbi:MAG: NADPH-dependent 7-cyano-7-deazaguanine reductase QueF [Chthoniobacterales bacterium]|nr:NADPH-dependent 7-cyano-7-deazaguanine reductase QueF [Chthoniobacterales bacterium]